LAGEKGQAIAESMQATSRYTGWVVAVRTRVIDDLLLSHLGKGVETIVNLGAGLDARPYRMALPESLHWVEADYPHVIEYKQRILENEKPQCRLERVELDLAEHQRRNSFFAELAARGKKTLILMEGVIPYLEEAQVAKLAEDLHRHPAFQFWITEYLSPRSYKYLNNRERARKMGNAPFRFFPQDWFGVFKRHGWGPVEMKFLAEQSRRLHRDIPSPWWVFLLRPFLTKERIRKMMRSSAYVVMGRAAE
jgi:methyltransferase (TIGR00027 family)